MTDAGISALAWLERKTRLGAAGLCQRCGKTLLALTKIDIEALKADLDRLAIHLPDK